MKGRIEEAEILRAQQMWAEGIVTLGRAYKEGRVYTRPAREFVSQFYGYAEGKVLFKPTRACTSPFRLSQEGAVSYFVGGNPDFYEDHGFALQPWEKVWFENAGFVICTDQAFAMGNYYFLDDKGQQTKVEYTLGYFRATGGNLKINVHHSSLPFKKA